MAEIIGTRSYEVIVEVEKELMDRIVAKARECAEDLKAEVCARYPGDADDMYPTDARRRERDLQPANDLMSLLEEYEHALYIK
jgi:hypothetical protein